ncbi:MAG TPA: AAA family ATPase, partial [Anaerolineales bacterium]
MNKTKLENPAHSDRLAAIMDADLQGRLRKARLEAAGQNRQAAVMFVIFSGQVQPEILPDSEDMFELAQQFVNLMASIVYKHEGIIDRVTNEEVIAIFGAPVAHENSAELAVRAALEIQANFSRYSAENHDLLGVRPSVKIGLHAGTMIIDRIQNRPQMEYIPVGDTITLTEKLARAASAGIVLASDSIYTRTATLFEYKEKEIEQAPGEVGGQLTHCYQPLSIKMTAGSVRGIEGLWSQMIGRDSELLQLERAFQRTIGQNQVQFVLITGEAGIGKSRLVAEFKRLVGQEHISILEGQGLAHQQFLSYSIFLNLLRNHLGLLAGLSEAQVREKLFSKADQLLGGRAAEATPYLLCLFGLQLTDRADEERILYLEPSQLRQQIFLAVRDLLLAQARQGPLLLILEDYHWADNTSIDLLQFLLATLSQAPVLVIVISRPFELGAMGKLVKWSKQHLEAQFVSIQLQNLSAEESEQLLYQLLSIPDLPETLRETILQRAAGIPFYLEEILRMLMDRQLIRRKKGRWSLAPNIDAASLGVPATLQELILARFDQLDPVQRSILQAASVIGHQFSLPLLKTVLPMVD